MGLSHTPQMVAIDVGAPVGLVKKLLEADTSLPHTVATRDKLGVGNATDFCAIDMHCLAMEALFASDHRRLPISCACAP